MEFFDLLVIIIGLYCIFRIASHVWNKPDPIDKTLETAVSIEQEYKKVSKFEEEYKDLPEKMAKVNEFKKKGNQNATPDQEASPAQENNPG